MKINLKIQIFTIVMTFIFSQNFAQTKQKSQSNMKTSIFLLLDGQTKEAMQFYAKCFKAKLEINIIGESTMKGMYSESMHHRVLNATLKNDIIDICASDWARPNQAPIMGNQICIYVNGGTPDKLKNIFERLSEEANITDPLKSMPFGTYGALNDKFGVRWMFQANPTQ
jgi:PhnB protein